MVQWWLIQPSSNDWGGLSPPNSLKGRGIAWLWEVYFVLVFLLLQEETGFGVFFIVAFFVLFWFGFFWSGIKPRSPASQADSLPVEPQGNSFQALGLHVLKLISQCVERPLSWSKMDMSSFFILNEFLWLKIYIIFLLINPLPPFFVNLPLDTAGIVYI